MKQVIIEPFHVTTRILMNFFDSVSGHVKTSIYVVASFYCIFLLKKAKYDTLERYSVTMKQVIIEPFHVTTRILMKFFYSVSGHVKTRNQVLVYSIQPLKIWAKKKQINTRENLQFY